MVTSNTNKYLFQDTSHQRPNAETGFELEDCQLTDALADT